MSEITTKICSKCNLEQSFYAFYRDSHKKSGYRSICKICCSKKQAEWKSKNSDYRQKWVEKNPSYEHSYYESHKNKIKQVKKEYRKNNADIIKKKKSDYTKKNRGIHNAAEAKRKAIKLNATPKWADLEAIKNFYKNCPKGYTVDHIYPLQGKTCCGLHVLNNLQYLTKAENSSKGNKMPEDLRN